MFRPVAQPLPGYANRMARCITGWLLFKRTACCTTSYVRYLKQCSESHDYLFCIVGPPIPFRVSPEVKTKIIKTAVACKAGIRYGKDCAIRQTL